MNTPQHSTLNTQRSTPNDRATGGCFVESSTLKVESWKFRSLPGFTLIELLAVITIIVLITGLVIGLAAYAQRKAATSRTQAEMAELSRAIEAYQLDFGRYPTSTGGRASAQANSAALYLQLAGYISPSTPTATSGTSTYLVDPFGNSYNYFRTYPVSATQTNRVTFDLWSYGPNGLSGTPYERRADITNC